MSKISDELRDWCDRNDENGCGGFVTEYSFEDICDLADRIDAELVELPKDADGVPIHVGDTVYLDDGHMAKVVRIELMQNESCIDCWVGGGKSVGYLPSGISHKPADSWERIADELDEMVDAADSADDRCERLADLADRIRRLAAKEEER